MFLEAPLFLNKTQQEDVQDCACGARAVRAWAMERSRHHDLERASWSLEKWGHELHHAIKADPALAPLRKIREAVVREAVVRESLREVERAIESYVCRVRLRAAGQIHEKVSAPGRGSRNGQAKSFGVGTDVLVTQKKIFVPGLGWLRLKRCGYLPTSGARILSVRMHAKAGQWFVTLEVEVDVPLPQRTGGGGITGVDLGIKKLATLADGTTWENPRATERHAEETKRLEESLARKQPGSRNQKKARQKLAKHQVHVANIRRDNMHKVTSALTREYDCVAIEQLDVPGMIRRSPQLSQAIQDVGFGQFRRQMLYKDERNGSFTAVASPYFPSSQRCSGCGALNRTLSLMDRRWRCPACGLEHDRDQNAAQNLEGHIAGSVTEIPFEEVMELSYGTPAPSEEEASLEFPTKIF